ncbi:MAG: hypothetical protein KA184_23835, partial [Candidatus Hydrogenedentes bacterium]|nr:hypothetical protein [Candidatus Hydrogenedentota bacterium]
VIIDLYGSATPLPVFSCGAAAGSAASGWGDVAILAGTALALARFFAARRARRVKRAGAERMTSA